MTIRSQLADAERKIRDLENEISSLRQTSKPMFDIPPDWILRAASAALKKERSWTSAYAVLTAYCGVPLLHGYHNPDKVNANAIATYWSNENTEYSKTKEQTTWTAMHELGHHICAKRPMKIGGEAEQAFCDEFANAIQARNIL